ncbi:MULTISPECIES: SusC/RagA family TonB-linked outer membrane protein [unclassified Proteiniphilum]|jgi:TonB-linked SusC/RagA family outer membrane protein|uniref:SusC/RagA family TonB-linked outer membrane protein n=1 Tax=unclassified Proteiniphilum TaxID=2622718 RepID=UPI00257CCA1A|nr:MULTISPECIES: TonB-dependent receptor [unclassified Proteiniphilum]
MSTKFARINFLLMFTFFLNIMGLSAQNITLRGNVSDGNNEPLIGVNVVQKGTTNGTVTDIDGNFNLQVPKGSVIAFSYIGFLTQELPAADSGVMNVVMSEDTGLLDEVVVVGYGTQSRYTLTTAIGQYSGEKMEGSPVNSIGENLKGKVSGLRVATTSMEPGANPRFLIRGGSSINQSNDPIIMVDGVQRDMTGLNPNDIESIEILKDAASAGIYGSRASNGVILITTKKGTSSKKSQIVFNAQLGYQQPERKYDLMNAADYLRIVRPALEESLFPSVLYGAESAGTGNNEGSKWTPRYLEDGEAVPNGWQSIIDPVNPTKTIIFQDNDQQSQWFGDALWQSYYVGVNGGADKMTYAASAGYTSDSGMGVATGFDRFTFHGNTSFEVVKNLTASTTFDYGETKMEDFPSNTRNTVIRGLSIPNTHRDYLEDGTPALGTNNTTITAAFYDRYYVRNNIQKRSSFNMNLNWKIVDGLNAVVQISNHNRHTRSNSFIKANAISTLRETREGFSELNRVNFQTYLNYKKSFADKHRIDLLGGYDFNYDKVNSLDAAVTGAISDKVPTLNAGTESVSGYPTNTRTREAMISYFGRGNYSFLDRYMLSLTMRADASSKFAKENRWGYFPATSFGWLISEEPFWNVEDMNMFKLRLSYGLTGNNGIGLYDTYGSYNIGNIYNGNATTTLGIMPNHGLTWETTSQFNIGVDLGFFDNRIRVIADYYNKVTSDLLFDITLPDITGYSTATANIGKVRFYGADFELSSVNIRKKNFEWSTDFTYSYNMNKVLKLPDNGIPGNRINGIILGDGTQYGGIAEGERLGRFYGYKVDHILETEAQADAALYDALSRGFRRSDRLNSSSDPALAGRKDVGDYEWKNRPGSSTDANGNDIINAEDQFLLGYVAPHSTGGLTNNFRYRNFSLSITLDYALGHSIFNAMQMRYFMATMGNANYNLVNDVKTAWKKPGDNTKYARFTANDPDWGNRNYGRTSDIFTEKGDYLALRDVVFSYDLSSKLIRSFGMQNLTLSLSGNTLMYFTAVKGVSPEAVTTGGLYSYADTYSKNYNPYPPARKILFGLKAVF